MDCFKDIFCEPVKLVIEGRRQCGNISKLALYTMFAENGNQIVPSSTSNLFCGIFTYSCSSKLFVYVTTIQIFFLLLIVLLFPWSITMDS